MIEKSSKSRQSFYALPGGTQEAEETLHRSLIREVFEETSATIEVLELLTIKERKVRSKKEANNFLHKIEYIFRCSVDAGYKARMGHAPDTSQIGVKWIPIEKLSMYKLATKRLRKTMNQLLVEMI